MWSFKSGDRSLRRASDVFQWSLIICNRLYGRLFPGFVLYPAGLGAETFTPGGRGVDPEPGIGVRRFIRLVAIE